jgi:signal transduction histidine kinase
MELKCSDISFPQVLEDMKQEFEVICQKKDLNFEFYNPCNLTITIWNDAFQLRRILHNLIGNSVKFTPVGGKITLRIDRDQTQSKYIKISVIDTGIGIPKEDQEMIFEKFHRTKHSEKVICSGTGLGLNIVKLLIGKLGGEISVKSEKDKGSCFTFLLPNYLKQ